MEFNSDCTYLYINNRKPVDRSAKIFDDGPLVLDKAALKEK